MRRAPLALALLAAACSRPSRPGSAVEPLQRLTGLTMSQTFENRRVWDLTARTAVLADQESKADVTDPKMTFFQDGKAASRLTAHTGVVGMKDRDVLLSSAVVVVSIQDESRLETEELRFLSGKRKFFTDKEVLVKRPGATLRGSGLEATPDLTEIRVFNQRSVITEKGAPL